MTLSFNKSYWSYLVFSQCASEKTLTVHLLYKLPSLYSSNNSGNRTAVNLKAIIIVHSPTLLSFFGTKEVRLPLQTFSPWTFHPEIINWFNTVARNLQWAKSEHGLVNINFQTTVMTVLNHVLLIDSYRKCLYLPRKLARYGGGGEVKTKWMLLFFFN